MFAWFKKRREAILAEADEFLESFGDHAYAEARHAARKARECGDTKREKFLRRVCTEVAKRTDFEIGLDTATRYLEKQTPYDPGPGIVRQRPHDATLH